MSIPGRALQELAIEAIGVALDAFRSGENNPFVILIDRSDLTHQIGVGRPPGPEALDAARRVVTEMGETIRRYVVAYDGYYNAEGLKTDAVFVEVGERGEADAFVIVQRYGPGDDGAGRIGPPSLIGLAKPLLA